MVPHYRARRKAKGAALFLQSPAKIDIVTGHPELRIESTDLLQSIAARRQVAPGEMFCHEVRDKHMRRSAGGISHAICEMRGGRWQKVWATDGGVFTGAKSMGEVLQPITVRISVIIDIGDDLAGGSLPGDIARGAQTAVLSSKDFNAMAARYRRRLIG